MKYKTILIMSLMALALAALVACSSGTATTGETEGTAETTAAAPTSDAAAVDATSETTAEATTDTATTETTGETTATTYSLEFPVDSYTEETVTVTTSSGDVEVTYRLYAHIPYVANPVDTDYQSLDVKVPVSINGEAIDATNAPMLLVINVGGYMSVSNAAGGQGVGAPVGGLTDAEDGEQPEGAPTGGMPGGDDSGTSGAADLALAAGYVVVVPGVRGRDNQAEDGTYYGKAPAAIVDLKAAVSYVRYNDALIPGNAEWIVSRGTSAGGALSALLGASGNSAEYDAYLEALGAADAADNIYASADYCPITDLDHADMAYEWMFGSLLDSNSEVSQQLAAMFPEYLASLNLDGGDAFGTLTADNYQEYLLQTYLIPSATTYLAGLSDEERTTYLAANTWITWADGAASFTWADYLAHVGRSKDAPAFDKFDLSAAENILFGTETVNARNFTDYGLQQASGDTGATIDAELQMVVNLMNPMYFLTQGGGDVAQYWWIRQGSSDTDTGLPVLANLSTLLENQGQDVNTWLYWDAGHGADEDPEAFIEWIGQITGYTG